ncbi:phospholipase D-like domain-containing protein [Sulfuriroseicoccus oceanibius]|uniref:Phosphatidylserine/phosphatidylglycerophosphate/ cardiolipin synthase family protein n=1 Tax=Sulfuriroseicoccus oceanibius TaxID=2707525 RepID=A0A6B3L4Y1_9BACT|nr:phospholipase D-like domain-containing protein [Sulfuriroseicoccus oceanibius]QQL43936.1 phosphatidylserine/phosphatidylglycerophosphate/cardiolipin synthase family protein [Sulfuriroseicoccus oceanibius]
MPLSAPPTSKGSARFAARNILPKSVRDLAESANELKICSPYVTDPRVLLTSDATSRILITQFKAINFITKASDIAALKMLVQSGVQVFHCEDLHAKIILIDDTSFAIGSQNLTHRGRKNIEANVISGFSTPTARVVEYVEEIQAKSTKVDLDEILKMEALVAPLQQDFEQLKQESLAIDQQLEELKRQREAARAQRKKALQERVNQARERRRREQWRTRLKKALNEKTWQASKQITARLKFHSNGALSCSLTPADRRDSFIGLIESIGIAPQHLFRYPMVNIERGNFAFARLAGTRISYFAPGVVLADRLLIDHREYQLTMTFDQDADALLSRTGTVKIQAQRRFSDTKTTVAVARFLYTFEELSMVELERTKDASSDPEDCLYFKWTIKALSSLENTIEKRVLTPFKFEHNLYGFQPDEFLGGDLNRLWTVQAHRVGDGIVLSATPV